MPINNFSDLNIFATLIALAAGIWGSIISFIRRNKDGIKVRKGILLFFIDMTTNIGLTMLVYLGLIGYGLNELVAVAISGFVGHQGTRGVYLIELTIAEKVGSRTAIEEIKERIKNDGL